MVVGTNEYSEVSELSIDGTYLVGIVLDCLNFGVSVGDALSEIKKGIVDGTIPAPSTIHVSNRICLNYRVKNDVEVMLNRLGIFLKIADLLSDLNAEVIVDLDEIWNFSNLQDGEKVIVIEIGAEYSLLELHETLGSRKEELLLTKKVLERQPIFRLVSDRVSDLEVLWRYRGNQNRKIKGYCNDFAYIYSFHLSFFVKNYFELQQRVKWLFNRAEISLDTDFEQTVRQAFNDCNQFLKWFVANNYVMKYAVDGVIRPHRSETIVKLLNISKREEAKLKSIVSESTKYERKKVREAERLLQKRRNRGTRSRESVLYTKRRERVELRSKGLEMLKNGMSKKTVAKMLNISRPTLYKVLSEEE